MCPARRSRSALTPAPRSGHDYLLNLFLSRNRVPNKQVYHHTTTATDTKNMQYVLNDVRNVVLENNLNGSGFMG